MKSINKTTMSVNKKYNEKVQSLDINIPSLILTPLTCASLISEILKCLIFEKSLIPYPYNWLKHVAVQHKSTKGDKESNKNFKNERQQRLAIAAFDATENIICNIKKLFELGNSITELLILIGATPLNPKEVYRLSIPKIAKEHYERNHYSMITKYQPRLLRLILLSKEWMSKMEQSIPLTNLYVFVKVENGKSFLVDNNTMENFVPSSSFFVPKTAQSLSINLLYDDHVLHNCCSNLVIYEDKCEETILEESTEDCFKEDDIIMNDSDLLELKVEWLQVNSVLKGFK